MKCNTLCIMLTLTIVAHFYTYQLFHWVSIWGVHQKIQMKQKHKSKHNNEHELRDIETKEAAVTGCTRLTSHRIAPTPIFLQWDENPWETFVFCICICICICSHPHLLAMRWKSMMRNICILYLYLLPPQCSCNNIRNRFEDWVCRNMLRPNT